MGMDPSSIMGGGGGIMGMIGGGMSGYSKGVQQQQPANTFAVTPTKSADELQGQQAGIAANQAQRNQSLLSAVQNLKAANALGTPGGLPAPAQSIQVAPQTNQGQPNARQMPFADAAQMLTPDQQWAGSQPVTPQQWGQVQDSQNYVNNNAYVPGPLLR